MALSAPSTSGSRPKEPDNRDSIIWSHWPQIVEAGNPNLELSAGATATTRKSGAVLLVGKDLTGIFDPSSMRYRPIGRVRERRSSHSATLLADGTVLIAGGAKFVR